MDAKTIERFLELLAEAEAKLYEQGVYTLDDMWW